MPEIYLDGIQSAGVDMDNPTANASTSSQFEVKYYSDKMLLVQYELPESIKHKTFIPPFFIKIETSQMLYGNWLYCLDEPWDQKSVSYNNMPEKEKFDFKMNVSPGYVEGLASWSFNRDSYRIRRLLEYGLAFGGDGNDGALLTTTRGTNIPRLKVNYIDSVPIINTNSCTPKNYDAYPPHHEHYFNIPFDLPEGVRLSRNHSKSALIEFMEIGTTEIHSLNINAYASYSVQYTIPVDTFLPFKKYQWRATITTTDNMTSTTSTWMTFQTTSEIHDSYNLKPHNEFVINDKSIKFEWEYTSKNDWIYGGYHIQWSIDKINWYTIVNCIKDGWQPHHTIAANTFPSGTIFWRVNTKNLNFVEGNWSEPATIINRVSPVLPTNITTTNEARPTLTWNALGHITAEIIFLEEDKVIHSCRILSGKKIYKTPVYLPCGSYTIKIRGQDDTGNYSQWAFMDLLLHYKQPPKPTIHGLTYHNAVSIIIDRVASHKKVYILRNGIPVKFLPTEEQWTDYTANDLTTYTCRVIDAFDNMIDSDPISIDATVSKQQLASISEPWKTVIIDSRADSESTLFSSSMNDIKSSVFCTGRKYAVWEVSEFSQKKQQLEISYPSIQEAIPLKKLIAQKGVLLYRDNYGEKFYCTVPYFSYSPTPQHSNMSLSLEVVDFVESIEYGVDDG